MKGIGKHVFGQSMDILIWLLSALTLVSGSHPMAENCVATVCHKLTTLEMLQNQSLVPAVIANLENKTQNHVEGMNLPVASSNGISTPCAQDLNYLLQHYSSFADQFNTISDNIFEHARRLRSVWPDTFDQCLSFRASGKQHTGNIKIQGQYCIAYLFPPRNEMSPEQVDILNGVHRITRYPYPIPETGLCLPRSCTAKDVQEYLKFLLRESSSNYTAFVPPKYCQVSKSDPVPLVTKSVATVILLIIAMAVVGTALEVSAFMEKPNQGSKQEKEKSSPNPATQKESTICSIVKCFSLFSNSWYLFKMDTEIPGELDGFNGIRFVSALGCQAMHLLILASHNGWNNSSEHEAPFLHAMTLRGFFYVQLLLQSSVGMSGAGIAMSTLYRIQVKDKGFYIVPFYLRRLWRLSVPYYVVIALVVGVVPYLGSGPKWPSVERSVDICKSYWWANVLYLNNYTKHICLFQTWYLSADMQLLLIAPLVILAFNRSARFGFAVTGVFASLSVSKLFYMAYFHSVDAWHVGTYPSIEIVEGYFWNMYFLPHSRLGCYCIGIAFGYVMYTYGRSFSFDKPIHRFLPSVAAIFILSPFWLWFRYYHHETLPVTNLEAALCEAFCRVLFTASSAYVGVCVNTGRQDGVTRAFRMIFCHKFFIFTAKLSYAVFLLHAIVLEVFLGTRLQAMEFSGFQMLKVVFGTLFITHLVAIPFTLLVVFPALRIERVFEDRLNRKKIDADIKLSKEN